MKDFLGKELQVGDKVVYITPGYRDYSTGTILRFTACYVFIETSTRWSEEIKQTPDQLIKI
jgi:hypothetical protein